ncbi:MAG: TIGR01777 family oxidoreductase, partial [Saprospiraceae bacterium]|nr:TIGR01777 family oxidoreductase [Saprospiraceae bacterium]
MKTILIGGGTGLVGERLSEMLESKGYKVLHLSRSKNLEARFPAYQWDLKNGFVDPEAIAKADAVINLAGAGIADKPWTTSRKKVIIDSRVDSTLLLKTAFELAGKKPAAFISAAAIGYYGNRGEENLTEDKAPGNDGFLSESCVLWEEAVKKVAETSIRTVWFRIGIVLSTKGGALEKIMLPVKFHVGGYFGNGKQWYSWIHLDDLCQMFIHALENPQMEGVYNAVSPHPERNKEFTRLIGEALGKAALMVPGPEFA